MEHKERPGLQELDDMNAVGCLLVILIHVLSLGISSADPRSWQAAVIYFPWKLAAFVVPMFLFTGGVKLARQMGAVPLGGKPYLQYIKKRLIKIYAPYVAWFLVYYFVFLQIGYVRGSAREFLSYLLIGNLSSQFYYIVILMQFYVLAPFWVWLMRRIALSTALAFSVVAALLMQKLPNMLSLIDVEFPYGDRIFLSYLVFWILGLYVGKEYEILAPKLNRWNINQPILALLVVLSVFISYMQYREKVYIFDLNNFKLVSDVLSILLMLSICVGLKTCKARLRRLLDGLHRASFSVYLSHCLFLTLITAFLQNRGITNLTVLLSARFAICYTLPFLFFKLFVKVKSLTRSLLPRSD